MRAVEHERGGDALGRCLAVEFGHGPGDTFDRALGRQRRAGGRVAARIVVTAAGGESDGGCRNEPGDDQSANGRGNSHARNVLRASAWSGYPDHAVGRFTARRRDTPTYDPAMTPLLGYLEELHAAHLERSPWRGRHLHSRARRRRSRPVRHLHRDGRRHGVRGRRCARRVHDPVDVQAADVRDGARRTRCRRRRCTHRARTDGRRVQRDQPRPRHRAGDERDGQRRRDHRRRPHPCPARRRGARSSARRLLEVRRDGRCTIDRERRRLGAGDGSPQPGDRSSAARRRLDERRRRDVARPLLQPVLGRRRLSRPRRDRGDARQRWPQSDRRHAWRSRSPPCARCSR